MQINHLDGNKLNNHFSNFEVCTPQENSQHSWDMGLSVKRLGSENLFSKTDEDGMENILNLMRGGCSNREISEIFWYHSRYVSLLRHGKRWSHVDRSDDLPNSFDYIYSREKLLQAVMLIDLGVGNRDISNWIGIERSQVSRIRNRKSFEAFFDWYDRFFSKGWYVPTNILVCKGK